MLALLYNPVARMTLLMIVVIHGLGCAGYQVGARSLYQPDIATVHVPMFQSDSLRRGLSERLTEAVVKEIELRTPYKVVSSVNADSVLQGRLVSDQKRALVANAFSEPRVVEVGYRVNIIWTDRRGNALGSGSSIPLSNASLNINQTASFIPEAGQSMATAQQQAIEKLARQIVSQMEAPW